MDPKNPNNWFVLAVCHKRLGAINDAIKEYSKVLEIKPQHQKASFNLADIYLEQRDFNKAYKVLKDSQIYYPDHPYTTALLAHISCETGDLNNALSLFEKAFAAGLNLANSYFNFAICLINHGNMQESRKYFLKALELNPNDEDTNYFIAVTYDNEKDYQKASYYYKKYLERGTNTAWTTQAKTRIAEIK